MARGKYQEWLEPGSLVLLEGWARDGLTDEQLAKNMGIATGTLYAWKKKYKEIDEALKKGKEVADYEVENAMHKSATGYFVEETKTYINEVEGVKTRRVETYKRWIAPNTAAQIFWLKNRRPDKWREKREEEDGSGRVVITGEEDVLA
ncbi:MAG: helix-turn-helix domain-containing protein [Peptoniphilus sp.]|nr:transposase [Peptoniphilus sp.]MDY3118195.1 helix-turn-helix domain-containing protein [Peptoniphilus sp.]